MVVKVLKQKRDPHDLGRYGLGLKTASLSQCRKLTVLSKQGKNIFARCWDIDYVIRKGAWALQVLEGEELNSLPTIEKLLRQESGTLVIWQNLDRLQQGEIDFEKSLGRKMDEVREHLQLVYHRYLAGEKGIKKIEIYFNNLKLQSADPFLIKKSTQAMDDEVINIHGEKVIIRPYILPHISKMTTKEKDALGGKDGLRRQQGFYVYRNKRLVVWGTWFKMMRQSDMSKLARIMVDIPNSLDNLWTLDVKKSHATPPFEIRKSLQSIIEKMGEKSKRTWTYRGKKETSDSVEHIWNRLKTRDGGVSYEINKNHPFFINIVQDNPSIRKKLELYVRHIESCLPLNQIYVDLNNDEPIYNDDALEKKHILDTLVQLLETMTSVEMKVNFLDKIYFTEPFSHHCDIIEQLKKELKS